MSVDLSEILVVVVLTRILSLLNAEMVSKIKISSEKKH